MAREAQAHQTLQQVQQLIARLEHRAGEQSRFEVQLEQLQTLVAGVRRLTPELISIARQTHQLALGTALEAARAGEGGRVFAQMAEDVQRVAAVSDSLAVDVSGLLGGLSALGAEALADSRRYEQEDLALARALAGLLPEHLATLDALAGAQGAQLQQLISQDLALVDEVDAALVALQFQDRVSQVLVAVEQDMQRLEREVKLGRAQLLAGERAEPIDAEAWMARLSQGFTTPEQHSLRRGAAPGPAQDDVGITFF
jgi:methyl-accepting chemotaxis protein